MILNIFSYSLSFLSTLRISFDVQKNFNDIQRIYVSILLLLAAVLIVSLLSQEVIAKSIVIKIFLFSCEF